MQRQSLGSPSSSKLVKNEQQFSTPPSSTSPLAAATITLTGSLMYGHEEEDKVLKKIFRPKPISNPPESYIHLIPMLTLICFFILYLSSHDPSPIDLAEFNGIKLRSTVREENISELQRMGDSRKGDILAIRSLKHLEQTAAYGRRHHRKMARV